MISGHSGCLSVSTSDNDCTPSYSPQEIASKLGLGSDFEMWLAKQEFDYNDPLLVVDFLDLNDQDKMTVSEQLLANNAELAFSNYIYKFATWEDLYAAKEVMSAVIPWLFYRTDGTKAYLRDGEWVAHPREQTIDTATISFYSEVTTKLKMDDFQFFKLF
ncbi:hypothetical protein Mgra_00009263 [Meloidogyne graminicola]|uniref:Uncharacterized protein n=1 Tax=Meloidogyne graminicola TaxID=189291 RepID=A0A8S9ZDD6_9BILA|nr:hypothetical protein Mgra_00009263 [Meloidogyne graminicola]